MQSTNYYYLRKWKYSNDIFFRSKSNAIYRWNTEHNTKARISGIILCSFFSIQKIIRKRSMKFCEQNLNWNFFAFWWLPHTETSIQIFHSNVFHSSYDYISISRGQWLRLKVGPTHCNVFLQFLKENKNTLKFNKM